MKDLVQEQGFGLWTFGGSVAMLLIAGLTPIVAAQGPAQGDRSTPLGDMIWPTANQTRTDELPDVANQVLNTSTPRVVGIEPITELRLERKNDTRTQLTLEQADNNTLQFNQSHRPSGSAGPDDVRGWSASQNITPLWVTPAQLAPTVEVTPRPGEDPMVAVQVYAPPGAFNLTDGNMHAKAADFGEKVGLPEATSLPIPDEPSTEWTRVSHGPNTTHNTVLFHGLAACADSAQEPCQTTVSFALQCQGCWAMKGVVHPTPGDDLAAEREGDSSIRSTINEVSLLFSPEGRLVWASLDVALDLDTDSILGVDEAWTHVEEYVAGLDSRPRSDGGNAILQFRAFQDDVQPREAGYQWGFLTVNESSKDEGGPVWNAFLDQNATTGEVIDARFTPNAVEEEGPGPGTEEDAPREEDERTDDGASPSEPGAGNGSVGSDSGQQETPSLGGVAALVAAAVALVRRRLRPES